MADRIQKRAFGKKMAETQQTTKFFPAKAAGSSVASCGGGLFHGLPGKIFEGPAPPFFSFFCSTPFFPHFFSFPPRAFLKRLPDPAFDFNNRF